jgi:hypothetical protein
MSDADRIDRRRTAFGASSRVRRPIEVEFGVGPRSEGQKNQVLELYGVALSLVWLWH